MFALMIDAFILSFIKWVTYFNVSLQMGHLDIKYNYNCKFFCSLLLSFRCGVVLFLSIPTFLLKKKIPFASVVLQHPGAQWSSFWPVLLDLIERQLKIHECSFLKIKMPQMYRESECQSEYGITLFDSR